jgi:hypothetical protein
MTDISEPLDCTCETCQNWGDAGNGGYAGCTLTSRLMRRDEGCIRHPNFAKILADHVATCELRARPAYVTAPGESAAVLDGQVLVAMRKRDAKLPPAACRCPDCVAAIARMRAWEEDRKAAEAERLKRETFTYTQGAQP